MFELSLMCPEDRIEAVSDALDALDVLDLLPVAALLAKRAAGVDIWGDAGGGVNAIKPLNPSKNATFI